MEFKEVVKLGFTFFIAVGLVFSFVYSINYVNNAKNCKIEYVDSSGQKQVINSSKDVHFRLGTRSVTIVDKINDTKKTIYGDIVVECKN
jgi:hypothetical protein